MAHPYQKYRERNPGRSAVKRILKADGGAIDDSIDLSKPGEGPYSLGQTMAYERAVKDRKEVDAGERFMDTGTRIPGQQKAKNDAYMNKRK